MLPLEDCKRARARLKSCSGVGAQWLAAMPTSPRTSFTDDEFRAIKRFRLEGGDRGKTGLFQRAFQTGFLKGKKRKTNNTISTTGSSMSTTKRLCLLLRDLSISYFQIHFLISFLINKVIFYLIAFIIRFEKKKMTIIGKKKPGIFRTSKTFIHEHWTRIAILVGWTCRRVQVLEILWPLCISVTLFWAVHYALVLSIA